MAAPNRYDLGRVNVFSLASSIATALVDDPNWVVAYSTVIPKPFNNINRGSMIFKNKTDPTLYFMLNINTQNNHFIQAGFYETDAGNIIADVGRDYSYGYNNAVTPLNTSGTGDFYYKQLTVFTTSNFVYINGEAESISIVYPLRLYMGRLIAYENEDPLIAKDFVGLFTHFPAGYNEYDQNSYSVSAKNVGQGFVKKSRNGTKNVVYNFCTSSQLVSPAVSGKFFISPFYVYENTEGVRGEFWDIYVVCFKDGSAYPDGSVLSVGNDKYYVFHVVDQLAPQSYNITAPGGNSQIYGRWYFFDTSVLRNSGGGDKPQRALLFKI
ncbi:hypothetical protein [Paenibacillus sp. FSL R7-0128]|uniref:hypothetical protein n=1 Tax=Paenibacillus sp. FSL R7-0128 TaxID=2954529 RepID=UPI0030FAE2F5